MPERLTEETLARWESMGGQSAGFEWVSALERKGEVLPEAIAEIRTLRGELAALVDVVKRYHEAVPGPESTAILASLSEAAAAHDKRLKAEGAAEARSLVSYMIHELDTIRRDSTEDFASKMASQIIQQVYFRLRVSATVEAEAAKLREEAGR